MAGLGDFDERFADGLKLYDSIPWQIMMHFVPDDQVYSMRAEGVFNPIDRSTMTFQDKRLPPMKQDLRLEIIARVLDRKTQIIGRRFTIVSVWNTHRNRQKGIIQWGEDYTQIGRLASGRSSGRTPEQ